MQWLGLTTVVTDQELVKGLAPGPDLYLKLMTGLQAS